MGVVLQFEGQGFLSFYRILGCEQSLKLKLINVSSGEAIYIKMMSRELAKLMASFS